MSQYALKAAKRDRAGKGVARSLRRENRIPGVIYGDSKSPALISLADNQVNLEYRKGHMLTSLCSLDVDGEKHLVLARDVQLHPVSDRVEHVDFMRVSPKTRITINVPVHFTGHDQSQGMKDKAVLNIVLHELEVICSATDIPDQIEVSLAGKKMGEAVRLSDAALPKGVEAKGRSKDFVIATLQEPKQYTEIEITKPVSDAEVAAAAAAAPAAGGDKGKAAAPAAKAAAPAKTDKK